MAFDPKLGQLFLFDADELRANNQGRLTAEQSRTLANAARITDRQLSRTRVRIPLLLVAVLALAAYAQSRTAGAGTKEPDGPAKDEGADASGSDADGSEDGDGSADDGGAGGDGSDGDAIAARDGPSGPGPHEPDRSATETIITGSRAPRKISSEPSGRPVHL